MAETAAFAWTLLAELRKELVEAQRIRTQVIGFKITFVSAAFALLAANLDKVPLGTLVIPAFAAVFFDLLIIGYSYSIKRIGFYCRTFLERAIREEYQLPEWFELWEEFLTRPETRQTFTVRGNIGFTYLLLGSAAVVVLGDLLPVQSLVEVLFAGGILLVFLFLAGIEFKALRGPRRFRDLEIAFHNKNVPPSSARPPWAAEGVDRGTDPAPDHAPGSEGGGTQK
jgi:hypothetical protein